MLRVEYFQQRGSRVALKRLAQLVDFIKHDHRVAGAGFFQRLDQFAGHGADVGAPMPLDFRLVTHAAQTEAVELAIQRIGDGFANAGFAHPGRAHQQNDGTLHFAPQGAHGEELDDAVFHIIQPAVVFAEHCLGMAQVQIVIAVLAPGHAGQPVEIITGHTVFWRAGFQHGQFL